MEPCQQLCSTQKGCSTELPSSRSSRLRVKWGAGQPVGRRGCSRDGSHPWITECPSIECDSSASSGSSSSSSSSSNMRCMRQRVCKGPTGGGGGHGSRADRLQQAYSHPFWCQTNQHTILRRLPKGVTSMYVCPAAAAAAAQGVSESRCVYGSLFPGVPLWQQGCNAAAKGGDLLQITSFVHSELKYKQQQQHRGCQSPGVPRGQCSQGSRRSGSRAVRLQQGGRGVALSLRYDHLETSPPPPAAAGGV